MSRHYIPRADLLALEWFNNFSRFLGKNYKRVGVPLKVTDEIESRTDAFAHALMQARSPATATRSATFQKKLARKSVESLCRQWAMLLKLSPETSTADKIAMRLKVTTRKQPRPKSPNTHPIISIQTIRPGEHVLRYQVLFRGTDRIGGSMVGSRKAKPRGAVSCQLFVAIADAKATNVEQAKFHKAYTKCPMVVRFDRKDDGKIATYWGRWADVHGNVSRWSSPVSMRIAA